MAERLPISDDEVQAKLRRLRWSIQHDQAQVDRAEEDGLMPNRDIAERLARNLAKERKLSARPV